MRSLLVSISDFNYWPGAVVFMIVCNQCLSKQRQFLLTITYFFNRMPIHFWPSLKSKDIYYSWSLAKLGLVFMGLMPKKEKYMRSLLVSISDFNYWPGAVVFMIVYISYIVAVSFIVGGSQSTRRKPPTCHKSLTNLIT
jgi:hypothetical protein